MKLYVTRHGETQYNVENRICGISDIELNDKGRKQAREIAEKFVEKNIDIIISSPLKRAKETAAIIADRLDKEIQIDTRLHEIDFGIFEGMPGRTDEFRYVKRHHAMRYPQGEKLFEVVQRVYNFLDEMNEKYKDKTILIVCHGGIVRVIHSYYCDMTNDEIFTWLPENCCFQSYEK